jgi:uncharacterized protein (DUF1778 family)
MTAEIRHVTARLTNDQYRELERACRRHRCRSMSQFLTRAMFHFADHNRNVGRPQEKQTASGSVEGGV